jgi:hypothetical protein
MQRVVFAIVIVFVLAFNAAAQERISPAEAAKYVGKNATVCGQVASVFDFTLGTHPIST